MSVSLREILGTLQDESIACKSIQEINSLRDKAEAQIKSLFPPQLTEEEIAEIVYKVTCEMVTIKEWNLEFPSIIKTKEPHSWKEICLKVAKSLVGRIANGELLIPDTFMGYSLTDLRKIIDFAKMHNYNPTEQKEKCGCKEPTYSNLGDSTLEPYTCGVCKKPIPAEKKECEQKTCMCMDCGAVFKVNEQSKHIKECKKDHWLKPEPKPKDRIEEFVIWKHYTKEDMGWSLTELGLEKLQEIVRHINKES